MEQQKSLKENFYYELSFNYSSKTYNNITWSRVIKSTSKEFPHLKFSPFISSQAIIQNGETMSGGMIFGVIPQKKL